MNRPQVDEHVVGDVDRLTGRHPTANGLGVDIRAAADPEADLGGESGRIAELADDERRLHPVAAVTQRVDVAGVVRAGQNPADPHRHARRVADQLVDQPEGQGDIRVEQAAVALLAAGRTDSSRDEARRKRGLDVESHEIVHRVVRREPHRVLRQTGVGLPERPLHLHDRAVDRPPELLGALVGVSKTDRARPRLGDPGGALGQHGPDRQAHDQRCSGNGDRERAKVMRHRFPFSR